jgi:hypothetical protein
MFDLEKSIADWRQQMLAAGIKFPVPLEELEIHLREEIERQLKSGLSGQRAFEIAVQQMGRAELIETEFRNAGFFNWWSPDTQRRINRIFALLWLANCTEAFLSMAAQLTALFYKSARPFSMSPDLMLVLLFEVILLRGAVASIRLLGGNNNEIRILHYTAMLGLAALVPQIIIFKKGLLLGIAAFNLVSLVLLRSPSRKNPSMAAK